MRPSLLAKDLLFLLFFTAFLLSMLWGKEYLQAGVQTIVKRFTSCELPLSYNIASIDPRFALSTSSLESLLRKSTVTWNNKLGKQVFAAESERVIDVYLIYDKRQQETDLLKRLHIDISSNRNSYNTLKARFEELKQEFNAKSTAYNTARKTFENERDAYQKDVAYWNARGGAPEGEYKKLQTRLLALRSTENALRAEGAALEETVETLNAMGSTLNRMARQLNLSIEQYNSEGDTVRQEFREGIYYQNSQERRIEIYQFENTDKLQNVLVHELGHALKIPHNENPASVMYELNESESQTITGTDIANFRENCPKF